MLGWVLFGLTAVFLGIATKRIYELENPLEWTPEYTESVDKYRQTIANDILTYLQVWMNWDRTPVLTSNTIEDNTQITLSHENTRYELNFDWAHDTVQIVYNFYNYPTNTQISKAKTFKFKGHFVPKIKMWKFIQSCISAEENPSGMEILTNIAQSARSAVDNPKTDNGEDFTDEDFRGLLYEAAIRMSDEVSIGGFDANNENLHQSLFMVLAYIMRFHHEEYKQYLEDIVKIEDKE